MGITQSKMNERLAEAARSQQREHDKKMEELKKLHDENLEKTKQELKKDMDNLSQLRLFFNHRISR